MKKKTQNAKPCYGPHIDLRAIEEEVLREGQQWMRTRLKEIIRDKSADFSPDGDTEAEKRPASDPDR